MRLVLGAGAVAAISAMAAGLVRFPMPDEATPAEAPAPMVAAVVPDRRVERRIRYVQLRPGQRPPPGATVIDAAQPTPRIIVTRVRAQAATPSRRVARTRQSG